MKGLKIGAVSSFVISMIVLLAGGYYSKDHLVPYPEKVLLSENESFSSKEIWNGQNVYQKYGLMDHGSIWGHGTLRGMDFSATTLHLIGVHMRNYYADKLFQKKWENVNSEEKSVIDSKVISEIKTNTYNPENKTLALTPAQSWAYNKIFHFWEDIFKNGATSYGFLPGTIRSTAELHSLISFFFWTAWAASVNRPSENSTYTNNWPPDKSVGNTMLPDAFLWSIISIIALLAILGLVIYVVHRYHFFYAETRVSDAGIALNKLPLTLSQFNTAKFFLVVILLFIAQTMMGGLLAHYTISPGSFYLDEVAELIPYSLAKTWHLQLAIFWIATSWIGTAIFLAPVISGKEPNKQGMLVNFLFAAVILAAIGSLAGTAMGIKGLFGHEWFWFGHQGWEYLELGKAWQILLMVGFIAWLFIVYRALKNRLYGEHRDRSGLVLFYTLSAVLVVVFFGFGLLYGRGTHLTVADYWRWFVVHIWVEGIFEFFGVAVIALFLTTLGLVDKESAMKVSYLTAILVFTGGIIGTAHHFFWYGGPSFWLSLGSVFSSLEPIPLILLVVRAWMEYRSVQKKGHDFPYKWPLFFLTASSFWNFLGAAVYGFSINLPIVNYYEHGTYLTTNHGHTALFGVYGMLSIALLLFAWRSLIRDECWNDRILKYIFWCLNGGLFLMSTFSLLPVGISQVITSYTDGIWLARSTEFYNRDLVQTLGELRIIPDTIIIIGALLLLFFLLKTYFKIRPVEAKDGDEIIKL
jgi:nitric oxide reductase subunit B